MPTAVSGLRDQQVATVCSDSLERFTIGVKSDLLGRSSAHRNYVDLTKTGAIAGEVKLFAIGTEMR